MGTVQILCDTSKKILVGYQPTLLFAHPLSFSWEESFVSQVYEAPVVFGELVSEAREMLRCIVPLLDPAKGKLSSPVRARLVLLLNHTAQQW